MERLRRLPWTADEEKPAYVVPGDGTVNRLADAVEAETLATVTADADRAAKLVDGPDTSRAELDLAVRYLVHAVRDAVNVATLRGERLAGADE